MLIIVYKIILPVILIFSLGFIGQKAFRFHIKSISTTALYLMTPALVFRSFYEQEFDKTYVDIFMYSFFLSIALIIIVQIIGKIKRYDTATTNSLILATAFMNSGNFGTPLILFAFGDKAFMYAVSIMVFHVMIMSTIGLYYAASGRMNPKKALMTVVKMPMLYALAGALLCQQFHIPIPEHINKAIAMVADASVILIMLVLGMQLAEIKIKEPEWGKIVLGLAIRLVLSPLMAVCFVKLIPVEPILQKVMIVEAAMPSAAVTTMFAVQFDTKPNLVTSITLISTLASIVTISLILYALQ